MPAKLKPLTNEQLRAAAEYLRETGQLADLMAHLALVEAKGFVEDVMRNEPEYGKDEKIEDLLADHAKNFNYESFFDSSEFLQDIESLIDVYAYSYTTK